MTSEGILDQLRAVIAKQFNHPIDLIGPSTTANDVVEWDSLSHAILLVRVEEAFGIELPEDEVFDLRDVAALSSLVERVLLP